MSELDIICPYLERDKDRFIILWESLQKFLKIPKYRIFLVSKTGSSPIKSSKIIPLKEKDLDTQLVNKQFDKTGWWKQQLIKLYSHKICETECILSLDCDCFLNKNLYMDDLIENNKVKINISPYGSWDNWYEGSRIISKLPYKLDKNKRIGVTPILLSNSILKSLNKYLNIIYSNNSSYFLLSNIKGNIYKESSSTWTEYCLYHIYADYTGMINKYHHVDSNFTLSGNCIWDEKDCATWDHSLSFKKPEHFFTIVQSIANKPADWVYSRIKDYLK